VYVVIVLALASELLAIFDAIPFHSVSGMVSFLPGKFWPQYKTAFSLGTFLCFAAILLAWGYGPMTTQAGMERQIRDLNVQVHELELDRLQRDSKIVLLEHEVSELERHRERLVTDVIAFTRSHSVTEALASTCADGAESSPPCQEDASRLAALARWLRPIRPTSR